MKKVIISTGLLIFGSLSLLNSEIAKHYKNSNIEQITLIKKNKKLNQMSPEEIFYTAKIETDVNKSLKSFNFLFENFPNSDYYSLSLLELSKIYYAKRIFTKSYELINKVKNSHSDKFYWSAKIAFQLEDYTSAIRHSQAFIEKSNNQNKIAVSYLLISKSFFKRKNYSKAINTLNYLKETVSGKPFQDIILYQSGLIYLEMKDINNAVEQFQYICNHYPDSDYKYKAENVLYQMNTNKEIDLDAISSAHLDINEKTETSTTPKTSNTKKPDEKESFYLQAGAFSNKNNALKRVNQIKALGYKSALTIKKSQNKSLNAVTVGPYTKQTALKVKSKLEDKSINSFLYNKKN